MTRQARAGLGFVLPVLIGTVLVLVIPTIGAALLSVTDFDIYALADVANLRFVGAGNYAELLRMPLFWRAVGIADRHVARRGVADQFGDGALETGLARAVVRALCHDARRDRGGLALPVRPA